MKKKILGLGLSAVSVLVLAGCGETASTTSEIPLLDPGYKITVSDIDGEVLSEEMYVLAENPTVKSALETIGLKGYDGDYGYTITSIAGSVIDSSYYVAIYENGEYASTGLDGLVADAGDEFNFTVECWNSKASGYGVLDDYDISVDKAVYHYAKEMKKTMSEETTYASSAYWEEMAFYMMNKNSYDSEFFKAPFNEEFISSVRNADISSFTGSDFFKWYYAARMIGDVDFTSFKTSYASYLDSLTTYEGGEYVLPFVISIAKELGLDSHIKESVKETEFRADTSYGPDGLAWEYAALALYNDFESEDLKSLTSSLNSAFSKDVSLSACLLAYAANGCDARSFYVNDSDVLSYLFDNYYDKTAMKFETEKAENPFGVNQIYAGLMAYKAERDNHKAVVLFA